MFRISKIFSSLIQPRPLVGNYPQSWKFTDTLAACRGQGRGSKAIYYFPSFQRTVSTRAMQPHCCYRDERPCRYITQSTTDVPMAVCRLTEKPEMPVDFHYHQGHFSKGTHRMSGQVDFGTQRPLPLQHIQEECAEERKRQHSFSSQSWIMGP